MLRIRELQTAVRGPLKRWWTNGGTIWVVAIGLLMLTNLILSIVFSSYFPHYTFNGIRWVQMHGAHQTAHELPFLILLISNVASYLAVIAALNASHITRLSIDRLYEDFPLPEGTQLLLTKYLVMIKAGMPFVWFIVINHLVFNESTFFLLWGNASMNTDVLTHLMYSSIFTGFLACYLWLVSLLTGFHNQPRTAWWMIGLLYIFPQAYTLFGQAAEFSGRLFIPDFLHLGGWANPDLYYYGLVAGIVVISLAIKLAIDKEKVFSRFMLGLLILSTVLATTQPAPLMPQLGNRMLSVTDTRANLSLSRGLSNGFSVIAGVRKVVEPYSTELLTTTRWSQQGSQPMRTHVPDSHPFNHGHDVIWFTMPLNLLYLFGIVALNYLVLLRPTRRTGRPE